MICHAVWLTLSELVCWLHLGVRWHIVESSASRPGAWRRRTSGGHRPSWVCTASSVRRCTPVAAGRRASSSRRNSCTAPTLLFGRAARLSYGSCWCAYAYSGRRFASMLADETTWRWRGEARDGASSCFIVFSARILAEHTMKHALEDGGVDDCNQKLLRNAKHNRIAMIEDFANNHINQIVSTPGENILHRLFSAMQRA